jgi:hypothetical protein
MVRVDKYPSAVLDSVETPAFTDLTRWRLKVAHGAQTWHYLQSDEEGQVLLRITICKNWLFCVNMIVALGSKYPIHQFRIRKSYRGLKLH